MGIGDYVTQVQFAGTMALLQEIRADIKGDVADLHDTVSTMRKEITERMDVANGRTSELEAALQKTDDDAAQAKAEAIMAKKAAVEVLEHGCKQLKNHDGTLKVLAGVGVVEPLNDAPTSERWRVTPKRVGVGAGLMGGGALLTIAIPKVLDIIHTVIEWATK